MRRLLLISCSATKSSDSEGMPAIERYRGTTFKMIKKARREGYWPENTAIFIVSAQYGLISEHTVIEPYDQKMTEARAVELQSKVSNALDTLLRERHCDMIFINMGRIYMQSIRLSREVEHARQVGILQEAVGSIGMRQQQTKAWLMAQYYGDLKASCVIRNQG